MASEQKLEIVTVTGKQGKEFKNLVLKPTAAQRKEGITGLKPDHYVIVKKVFKEGYENTNIFDGKPVTSYSCRAEYDGEEVSFWLKDREHEAYKVLGDEGSLIKITGLLQENKRDGKYYLNLQFDLVGA